MGAIMNDFIKEFKNTMVFLKGNYFAYFMGIIGMAVCLASSSLLESYLLKRLLDGGAPSSIMTIVKIIILVVVYMLIMLLLLPVFTFMFNGRAKYGHNNVNKAIYQKFGKLPVDYYEKNHSGKILSLIFNDTWMVASIFMRHFKRTITAFSTIFIYLVPMMIYDYRITLIILVLNILTLLVNTQAAKMLRITTKDIQKEMGSMTVIISNIIGGMSVIKMYQLSKKLRDEFMQSNSTVAELNKHNNNLSAKLSAYNFFISMLNTIVFFLLGSIMVKHNLTTYGNILAIYSLQTVLDHNFREFGEYFPLFYNCLASTVRVYDFLEEKEEPIRYDIEKINNPEYIEFKNVNFGYNDTLVIKDFNLQVQKGQTIALIGESGSGKSSVAKLLLGFYIPHSGSISVAGKNMSDMTLAELRDMIAYVPQEATLFNTTIMENIRYGRISASDDEIIEAAKAANAHDFIIEQEYGYNTITGEKGIRLSGGQCQRIAIARAILKNAPILLLDEATSALDNESESLIKETLEKYGKTRTTIMIAHRMTSIEHADRIFNMNTLSFER